MDFNVKKMVDNAGTFLSRAVQMTEEALHSGSEKTNLDPQLEKMCQQAEDTKNWSQRIASDVESMLTPNPAYRMEDFLMTKIEKKRPDRMSNMEMLGQGMIDAGTAFGETSAYGSMLAKVGRNELKLGLAERDFINEAHRSFINPLNNFLDNEVKVYLRERKALENKRLDLDSAKNKLRKARSLSATPPTKDGVDPRVVMRQAEGEVMTSQQEFNQQVELVKIQLEVLMAARDRHVDYLKAFVEAQAGYYARCQELMKILGKELEGMPIHNVNLTQSMSIDSTDYSTTMALDDGGAKQQGKVMYDHVAKNSEEMSVFANEAVTVEESSDPEYFIAHKGERTGKIPKCCVLLL